MAPVHIPHQRQKIGVQMAVKITTYLIKINKKQQNYNGLQYIFNTTCFSLLLILSLFMSFSPPILNICQLTTD